MTTHSLRESYLELASGDPGSGEFETLVRRELELLGEDPDREGLQRTPARVAAALKWMTQGYGSSAEEVVGSGIFEEEHDNMIMVRDIELYSMCEHHMLPRRSQDAGRVPTPGAFGREDAPILTGVPTVTRFDSPLFFSRSPWELKRVLDLSYSNF